MVQYTREQIRSFIRCPQLGSEDYGEWGILRLDQRLAISNLLDQLDSADAYIKKLYKENKELKEKTQIISPYYVSQNYIPKSVIREKIKHYEECEEFYGSMETTEKYSDGVIVDEICKVLRKILGDEDENRN